MSVRKRVVERYIEGLRAGDHEAIKTRVRRVIGPPPERGTLGLIPETLAAAPAMLER